MKSATARAASSYRLDAALVRRLTGVVPSGGGGSASTDPVTGGVLAELPRSSTQDVQDAFDLARKPQPVWAARPVREREQMLLRMHDLVLRHRDELLDLIQSESGKSRLDAFQEVAAIALAARYYGRTASRLLRTRRRASFFPGAIVTHEVRHPKGVVGIVSPWNFPLVLSVTDTLPALVAGNAVVHRPDDQAALTALRARELAIEAGLPPDLWQVVLGEGPVIGAAVVERADFVSFTGSSATGRLVGRQAGERLVGASLELGGKNPALVLADADLGKAADVLARACFTGTGQVCVSVERIYVHASIYDDFLPRFLRRVGELRLGVGVGWGYDVGTLVSAQQYERVTRHLEDARAQGAEVLTGGRPRPDVGPYVVEPTVLRGVRPGMLAFDDETFGPVVAVSRVASDDEAVEAANDSPYGLMGVVLSGSLRHGTDVAQRIRCGGVAVNESFQTVWSSTDVPLGGFGISGIGRRHGAEGLLRFTEVQAVVGQRLKAVTAPVGGLDPRRFAGLMSGAMRVMKAIGRK